MNQNQKKLQPKTTNTIDEKHTEMLQTFHEIETVIIPELLREKEHLKSLIPKLKEHEIDAYMDIRDKVLVIQKK